MLEPGLPGGQQRQVPRPETGAGHARQGGPSGGSGLVKDRAGRMRDLLHGVGWERHIGQAAREHVQHCHMRHAASLVIAQIIRPDDNAPPLD